jgi:hypothetical protein
MPSTSRSRSSAATTTAAEQKELPAAGGPTHCRGCGTVLVFLPGYPAFRNHPGLVPSLYCVTCGTVIHVHTCKICGCSDFDCSACIEATGRPCYWVQDNLCSRCAGAL